MKVSRWYAVVEMGKFHCAKVEVTETEKMYKLDNDSPHIENLGYASNIRKSAGKLFLTKREALQALVNKLDQRYTNAVEELAKCILVQDQVEEAIDAS